MAVSMLVERGQVISLISATAETFDAEDVGGEAIADRLGVKPPVSWPPEHNDPATRDWMRGLLADHPDEPGYVGWYMIVQNRLVGVCGFKGPPNIWGEVEIGYSVVEAEHRKGYGSRPLACWWPAPFVTPGCRWSRPRPCPRGSPRRRCWPVAASPMSAAISTRSRVSSCGSRYGVRASSSPRGGSR